MSVVSTVSATCQAIMEMTKFLCLKTNITAQCRISSIKSVTCKECDGLFIKTKEFEGDENEMKLETEHVLRLYRSKEMQE
jgi:hypothetical protein